MTHRPKARVRNEMMRIISYHPVSVWRLYPVPFLVTTCLPPEGRLISPNWLVVTGSCMLEVMTQRTSYHAGRGTSAAFQRSTSVRLICLFRVLSSLAMELVPGALPQAMLSQSCGLKTHFGMGCCPSESGKGFPSYRRNAMLCQSFGLKDISPSGKCLLPSPDSGVAPGYVVPVLRTENALRNGVLPQ